ncbi:RNA-binding S4 domain-containing protein [Piscirickettsia litoralis]|uniref:Heat shock protein 15 n=1 Tax=Piscirickettsia litoralis TaxID=1891921 RepID=A0ABX3A282_9GAMM|nr:S4 domain-containing protein [Piscirickettsia litoralis]ODN42744.1 RNA-binding protein [Piscirickettsia litoralis]
MTQEVTETVRLDKWLWAARFFKTRALAKTAIEGGKVHCNGQRIKPSHKAIVGAILVIRQGFAEKTVIIQALSSQRRGAKEAVLLYQETQESQKLREKQLAERKALGQIAHEGRPDKKQRRQLIDFNRKNL